MAITDTIAQVAQPIDLTIATQKYGNFLRKNPNVYKVVLLVNQLFRTVMMVALMAFLPYAPVVNFTIGLAGSLFYRISVERGCAFRFALPSCIGAAAYDLSRTSLPALTNGAAFRSLQHFAAALAGFWPLALWTIAITAITHTEVEAWLRR